MYLEGLFHSVVACAHLGKATGRRTATMAAPLLVLLTSGPVRYEAVLHSCGTSVVGEGGWYRLVTVCTHGNLYSTASLGQSHYSTTELTSPCPILIMPG